MKRIIAYIFIAAAVLSCQKEGGLGKVEVEGDVIYLPAEAGVKHVLVDATTEWRLEYDTSTPWMSTDLHGGKPNSKYFTISFLERTAENGLSFHLVNKKVPYIDENGNKVSPSEPNAIKFEQLILDMVHLTDTCLPYEIVREKEFAPVKNPTGIDSVESARELLIKNGVEI